MTTPWLRGGCIVAAVLMASAIFVGADSGAGLPLPSPLDKVVHFTYYGIMAGLLAHGAGRRWLWLPLILVPVIGAADELNQAGIPGRDASVYDWIADLAGAICAVMLYRYSTGWHARGLDGRAG